jgi:hypothetical protein
MQLLLSGALVTLVSMSVAILLVYMVRRRPGLRNLRESNDVTSAYATSIGTIYAVLLAFMLFSVWNRFDQARSNVEMEAAAMANIYRLADSLEQTDRVRIQQAVRDYGDYVVGAEWPLMSQGARMQKRRRMKTEVDPYDRLWKSVNAMQAGTNHTETVFGQELQQLTGLATYRRQRLLVSDTGLPGILWCVLILGGAATVAITALFGMDKFALHAWKASLLAALISLGLFAIYEIDSPFQGDVTISMHAFTSANAYFHTQTVQPGAPDG